MAKGVYKISGNTTPKVLEKNTYKVEAWYPETPYSERDSAKVTWELFVEENGKFRTTHIKKKGIGDFTFGKNAYKHTYKIEGYLYAPEGKEPMSLVIRPQKNDGASLSNEKEILGVRLTYEDGSKITKPLSYMDRLMATAKCQNLEGRYIIFELWEDDEKGSGHNKKNQSIIKSQPIRVDIRGYASWNFTLLNTFISLAQQREGEDKKHEYYVTAEYNGKILNNSGNINVNNPTPVIKITPKSSSKSKTTASTNNPQPKPQPNSAKGSTHQGSKNNQSDDKGIITSIKITDLKGQFFKKRPKFGERIQIVIEGKSIKGKDYTLRLWEDDTTGKNDLLYERKYKFDDNKQVLYVDLTEDMQRVGEIGNNSQNPDYGEYWTGNYQEIFAEVIINTKTAQSQIINVDLKAEAKKPEKTRTPTKVGETKKKEEKGKCPNCEKDITLDEIRKICVDKKGNCLIKDDSMIKVALPYLNKYRKKADINSCITKAHFIAQICQETKFYNLQEGFKYTDPERMRKLFYSYFKQFGELKNQQAEAKRLSDLSLDSKNWKIVANAIYGKTHPNGKNNTDKDDGWRYSGKGYKQITWKDNYNKVQKTVKNTFVKDVLWLDGDNPYKLVNNQEDAILSALAFWKQNNISRVATEISDVSVKNVTLLINPALAGYDERLRYFKKAVEILEVEKCKSKGELNKSNEKGTVVVVSGSDTKIEKDPYKPNEYSWVMYKTNVFRNMSLKTYYELEKSNSLPEADYTTYLSRDTHQTATSKGDILKHSDKRYGKYNEIPPGDYFLVPGISGQKYKIYVIDSESKSAASENGIDGPDGSRGGVALHHYCPRFSVGCFTFNSGANEAPVQKLIDNLPDLPLGDKKPVHFIVKPRKVRETTWDNLKYGTKKWIGI